MIFTRRVNAVFRNLQYNLILLITWLGVILDDIGFQGMMQDFIEKCITPFSKDLFPEYGGDSLDSHHAFIVK
jgi:hypothetical protein